jgi:catechol 2,3-dioxygenase-like lactoylglutathione lyase family enzyme
MWKLLATVAIAIPCVAQTQSLVKGVGNFIHDVSDLDQSVHFYRDLIGMEAPRPAGDWQTADGVPKMYGAAGAKFRVANAQVTGVAMRVEMVQFAGVSQKPVRRAVGEPGASLLILSVAELQPVIERLNAAKWPLTVKASEACGGRGIAVADPDGFPVLVVQRNTGSVVAAGKNVVGLGFGYVVSSDAVLNGPFHALGLKGDVWEHRCQQIEEALVGSSSATLVKLPDGFDVLLLRAAPGKKSAGALLPKDPGAAVLRLAVNDIDRAVRALSEAGA